MHLLDKWDDLEEVVGFHSNGVLGGLVILGCRESLHRIPSVLLKTKPTAEPASQLYS